jgi:tetratricopeptide (TPR) repeat protein
MAPTIRFAVGLLAAAMATAAGQDLRTDLQKQIETERRAGRIRQTEPLLEQLLALEIAERGESAEEVAPVLEQLGRIATLTRDYDRAGELYRHAIQVVEGAQGRNSPAVIPMLQALVRTQHIAQKFDEAVATQTRIISIRLTKAPDSKEANAELASDYVVLARLYAAQKKFNQAAPFYTWAVELLEKQFGYDDSRLLPALDGLSSALREDHKWEQAVPVTLRAIPIREALVGPMHPDLAQTLDNLGTSYFALKRFSDAEPVYERSVQIWIQHLGATHPMVATSFDNLGVTYASQNKFDKAEEIYRKALGIRDAEDAASLRNLATVLSARGKYADAVPVYKRALVVMTEPTATLASTLSDYADALHHLNRKVEASRIRARAKRIAEEIHDK